MTEQEFRVKYCELMEYYQYIEMHLKGLCADLLANEDISWFEGLNNFREDPFGPLVKKLREIQAEKNVMALSSDEFAALDEVRKKRNYWTHECFGGLNPIVFRNGVVRNNVNADKIIYDHQEAVEWDEKLVEAGRKYRASKKENYKIS